MRFDICINTLIHTEGADKWPKLCFQEWGKEVEITPPKALSDSEVEIIIEYPGISSKWDATVPENTPRSLLSWMRVYSRQYWIGYTESIARITRGSIQFKKETESQVLGGFRVQRGFQYGSPLRGEQWSSIGQKLASGELPDADQLIFCDALLDVAQGDMPQAVISLGISCEIAVNALIDDVLMSMGPGVHGLFEKYGRYTFDEGISKMIAQLGGQRFKDFVPPPADDANPTNLQIAKDAASRVSTLYRNRGRAAHRRGFEFRYPGDQAFRLDHETIRGFLAAVERFFWWVDAQRTALLKFKSLGP